MPEPAELPAPAPDVPAVPAARFLAARAALAALEQRVGDIRATVVATRDGLPVAATLPDAGATRLAAMAASVLGLAEQVLAGDDSGEAPTAVIRGSGGCFVVQSAGPAGVVAALTRPEPNLGLVQLELPATAAQLLAGAR